MSASSARTAVTAVFLLHGALFGTWAARIPAVKEELTLSDAELGLGLLFTTLGGLVAMPAAGWIVAREGSRTTARLALVLFALLLPVLALMPSLPTLAAALLLFGAAAGALDVAMNAHGLAVERLYARPILSSFHAGWSFGGLIGAGAGAIAAAAGLGPLPNFALVSLVVLAVGLVVSANLLPSGADRPHEPFALRRPPRRLTALAALAFCGLFAEGAVADWSAVYVDESLGGGEGVAALGFAAFSLAMAAGRLAGDRLTLDWGPVALTRRGGLLAAGALALALLVGAPPLAIVAFGCMGLGLAAFVPVVFRAAGSLPGLAPGLGIAALTTAGYTAFLVGPPVIGLAAEIVGLPAALGLVVALLAILVVLAPQTRPATSPDPEPEPA